MSLEIRTHQNLELRRADGTTRLTGYAAVFNSRSQDLGGFKEVIRQGAFSSSLGNDIYALVDHDSGKRLARTKNGTLKLEEDTRGLKVDITLPDTDLGKQIGEEVRTGLLDSMSFGFNVKAEDWTGGKNETIRELVDIELHEVSLVSFPAYTATVIQTAKRSLERHLAEAKQPPTKREIEQVLREAGLSRSVAKRCAAIALDEQREVADLAFIENLTRFNDTLRGNLRNNHHGNFRSSG